MDSSQDQYPDNKSAQPVTMQMVAERAGLSRSAVSYALRNHRSIPDRTRERVQAIAKEMGYRRNAYVSTLMAQVHRKRILSEQPAIAWIFDEALSEVVRDVFYQKVFEGAEDRAKYLGYFIEKFSWDHKVISSKRLGQVLRSRGIKGLIIAPISTNHQYVSGFPFDDFACSTIGYSFIKPRLHRVGVDYQQGMHLLWNKVIEMGYVRPGLVMWNPFDERTGYLNRGIFMALQSVQSGIEIMPPYFPDRYDLAEGGIKSWLGKYRPDVVLCCVNPDRLAEEIVSMPGSYRPDVFLMNCERGTAVSGIRQPDFQIGAAAVDIVVNQIHHSEQGIPSTPNTTLNPYTWEEVPAVVKSKEGSALSVERPIAQRSQ